MKFRLLGLVMVVCSLVTPPIFSAQTPHEYNRRMKEALQLHTDAGNFKEESEATAAYVEIGKDYPDQWLPLYWASYLNTQLANILGRVPDAPENAEPKEFLEQAQKHLDEASRRLTDSTDSILSDFSALQTLIHMFHARMAKDEKVQERARNEAEKSLKTATRLKPRNPLIFVMVATNLLRKEGLDINRAIAAEALLQEAKDIFETAPERALTTHWNQEWIDLFWLNHATSTVAQLSAEDELK